MLLKLQYTWYVDFCDPGLVVIQLVNSAGDSVIRRDSRWSFSSVGSWSLSLEIDLSFLEWSVWFNIYAQASLSLRKKCEPAGCSLESHSSCHIVTSTGIWISFWVFSRNFIIVIIQELDLRLWQPTARLTLQSHSSTLSRNHGELWLRNCTYTYNKGHTGCDFITERTERVVHSLCVCGNIRWKQASGQVNNKPITYHA